MLCLKQSALQSWNVALVGTSCGHLLHVLKDIFGLPESVDLVHEGETIAATFRPSSELSSSEGPTASAEPSGSEVYKLPPPLKRCKVLEMIARGSSKFKDKCSKIQMASGYYPTLTVALSMTGVDNTLVEKPSKKASIYRCVLACTQLVRKLNSSPMCTMSI